MIMVIFGAGASYDSVPSRSPKSAMYGRQFLPNRPPLASELFLDLGFFTDSLGRFPQCKPIVPYLRSIAPGETFEHVMETLQAEGETDPERQRQMAAIRFYLHYGIWECERLWEDSTALGITNYVTLLDQLRRSRREKNEPVLLVTFNYDRMIESALSSVKISISELSHYIQHDTFRLFKLHGSVQWAREVESPVINIGGLNVHEVATELIDTAPNLKITDRFRLVNNHTIGKIDNIPLFPAIAIPVETKRGFECPSDHLDCLRTHLGKITKVLIVGWRATERHFLELLKEHLTAEIHVQAVMGEKLDAEEVLQRIKGAGIPLVGEAAVDGFTEYGVRREAERFFSA
ncbi:MAG TPA: SIR2 family protein [Methylocella sp.]